MPELKANEASGRCEERFEALCQFEEEGATGEETWGLRETPHESQ